MEKKTDMLQMQEENKVEVRCATNLIIHVLTHSKDSDIQSTIIVEMESGTMENRN